MFDLKNRAFRVGAGVTLFMLLIIVIGSLASAGSIWLLVTILRAAFDIKGF